MTVFIAHAEADLDAAEALAKQIERRGLFVEHEGGAIVGRDLQAKDALVLLWSAATPEEPDHLIMERRALDAWADGRLVLVLLDDEPLPLGLRDLQAVDAADQQHWQTAWEETLAAVGRAMTPTPPPAPMAEVAAPASAPGPAGKRATPTPTSEAAPAKGGAGIGSLLGMIGALGLIGLAVYIYRRLQDGTLDMPSIWIMAAGAGGLIVLLAVIAMIAGGARKKPKARAKRTKAAPAPAEVAGGPASSSMFVSYAHDDALQVGPVVAAVERAGRPVWIDKSGLTGGQNWAGEIVRAIKDARGVMVLCSPAAFASDHVKREVYLADRYQKPLLPVFLEPAAPPEDFEYFFAGIQWIDLHAIPESDRAAAIKRALAAV